MTNWMDTTFGIDVRSQRRTLRTLPFHLSHAQTCCICTFIGLNIALFRVGHKASGIPCEMMVYFMYYRISISVGVWMPAAIHAVQLTIARLWQLLDFLFTERGHSPAQIVREGAHQLLGQLGAWLASQLVRKIASVVFMNTLFWFACFLFFKGELRAYIELYWWDFARDVFGTCAASGYKEAYGFDCIPFSAGATVDVGVRPRFKVAA